MHASWLVPAALVLQVMTNVDRFAAGSSFIFRGRVTQAGAATMPQVAAGDSTAVVRVEEVYHAAGTMPHVTGKEITLTLLPPLPAAGREYVFFTNVWLYGTSLAAREVGRIPSSDRGGEREQVRAAFERKAARALQDRVQRADLVVLGRVADTRPAPRDPRWPESEHDPQWWLATVAVEATAKGQEATEVSVVFAASADELWYDAPKFKAGQEGVWILQKDSKEKVPAAYAIAGYTALDRLDFQPREAWERVASLAATR